VTILNGLHCIVTVLTLPDSVAVVFSSDERSFPKLKLIKTYFCSCRPMTQEKWLRTPKHWEEAFQRHRQKCYWS